MARLVNSNKQMHKLRELILWFARLSETDDTFGAVKLNKLLFFADAYAYVHLGKSITGQEYQKLEQGPAPRSMLPTLEQMKGDGALAERSTDFYGRAQRKFFALREPDTSAFSREELDIASRVLAQFWGKTATDVSEVSHGFVGWRLARSGETIPLSVALVGHRYPTAAEIEFGLTLEDKAKACLPRG